MGASRPRTLSEPAKDVARQTRRTRESLLFPGEQLAEQPSQPLRGQRRWLVLVHDAFRGRFKSRGLRKRRLGNIRIGQPGALRVTVVSDRRRHDGEQIHLSR